MHNTPPNITQLCNANAIFMHIGKLLIKANILFFILTHTHAHTHTHTQVGGFPKRGVGPGVRPFPKAACPLVYISI